MSTAATLPTPQASPPASPPASPFAKDARTIGLVAVAHGTSHMFQMMLVPLFPAFHAAFGYSYAELALLMTVFFVISALGQAAAGFVVDKLGARRVLFASMAGFVLAALIGASAQSFAGLMLAAVVAAVANCPFHPVDFCILNQRVSQARLGHAYSTHGIFGTLGYAAAPLLLVGLTQVLGDWRQALLCMAAWAAVLLLVLWWQREAIDDSPAAGKNPSLAGGSPTAASKAAASGEHPLAFLRNSVLWLCITYFMFATVVNSAIQGFSSPALQKQYGLAATATAFVVTAYMLFNALGMVAGGFVVARVKRIEFTLVVAGAFAVGLLALVASGAVPAALAVPLVALAGIGAGIAGPSRDMLIKRAAPAGAGGRFYGTVYSSMDLGIAISSPVLGYWVDVGRPSGVFAMAAACLAIGVAAAWMVGQRVGPALPKA